MPRSSFFRKLETKLKCSGNDIHQRIARIPSPVICEAAPTKIRLEQGHQSKERHPNSSLSVTCKLHPGRRDRACVLPTSNLQPAGPSRRVVIIDPSSCFDRATTMVRFQHAVCVALVANSYTAAFVPSSGRQSFRKVDGAHWRLEYRDNSALIGYNGTASLIAPYQAPPSEQPMVQQSADEDIDRKGGCIST